MVKAKQIEKNLSAYVRVGAFSATGTDDVVTTPITTALNTAGDGGVSVPLQPSTAVGTIGVITTSPNNRVEIYNATTKEKINDASGDEVYGRLTHSGGVYTLSYFTLPSSGTETAYNFASSTSIDFEFSYRFDFGRYPTDGAIAVRARNVSDDPAAGGGRTVVEQLTVTGQNAIANLTFTPTTTANVLLIVNRAVYETLGTAAFSVSGRTITWSAANAGFNIETTDRVIASYTTNE